MTELHLHRQELAATVEALYEALMARMKWTLRRHDRRTPGGWGSLDFETAQEVINQLASALAKALMLVQEQENVHPEFVGMFTPPTEMWSLVTDVTLAGDWQTAPTHSTHEQCEVCRVLSEV